MHMIGMQGSPAGGRLGCPKPPWPALDEGLLLCRRQRAPDCRRPGVAAAPLLPAAPAAGLAAAGAGLHVPAGRVAVLSLHDMGCRQQQVQGSSRSRASCKWQSDKNKMHQWKQCRCLPERKLLYLHVQGCTLLQACSMLRASMPRLSSCCYRWRAARCCSMLLEQEHHWQVQGCAVLRACNELCLLTAAEPHVQ